MSQKCSLDAEYCCNNVELWASLETNFIRNTCTLEVARLSARFLLVSVDKKYSTFFGVTFSFIG